jgi:hypothetical protein
VRGQTEAETRNYNNPSSDTTNQPGDDRATQ